MTLITWLTHGPGAELSKGPRLDCAQSLIAIGVTYSTWVIVLAAKLSEQQSYFFLSGSAHSSGQIVALANSSALPRDNKDSKDSQNAQ
jgi:hypothetical protein